VLARLLKRANQKSLTVILDSGDGGCSSSRSMRQRICDGLCPIVLYSNQVLSLVKRRIVQQRLGWKHASGIMNRIVNLDQPRSLMRRSLQQAPIRSRKPHRNSRVLENGTRSLGSSLVVAPNLQSNAEAPATKGVATDVPDWIAYGRSSE
jgi:hypothetical protein